MENPTKKCLYCEKAIKGRTDKKFRNSDCKNNYNAPRYQLKGYARGIVTTLKKNRRILLSIAPAKKNWVIVNPLTLMSSGFNFHYHTHLTKIGNETWTFCFEIGYRKLETNQLLVIRAERLPENRKPDFDLTFI